MKYYKVLLIIYILSPSMILAHVRLDYPVGGETFEAGSTITIQWHAEIDHGPNNWDLYFSPDGGSTVSEIAFNLPKEQLNYMWIVPDNPTNSGIIIVVQDNNQTVNYQDMCSSFTIKATTTGITDKSNLAKDFVIYPAYPNPFNNSTVISFNLPEQSPVKINVFNIAGEKIKTLVNSEMQPGLHKIRWNADEVPSGVYFYAIETKNSVETRKLILLK
jgi:Secretion system C-terminal sorting domain